MTLKGLPGTTADREAEYAGTLHGFIAALRVGKAATTAHDYGAINAYIDDKGKVRVMLCRNQKTIDAKIFKDHMDAGPFLWKCLRRIRSGGNSDDGKRTG
jgi:hypothetical protein